MLGALKAVYDMFKGTCESYAARKTADAKEIADLRNANEKLVAEQATAMAMIEEMAQYLEKH